MTDATHRPGPPSEDDPTHALDDFVRRLRPVVAPPHAADDPADLSALQARLRGSPTVAGARSRAGVLRNGQAWDADDVEDVPVLDLPRVRQPRTDEPPLDLPTVDLAAEQARDSAWPELDLPAVTPAELPDVAGLNTRLREASDSVAQQQAAQSEALARPAWQPDAQALQLRRGVDARLLPAWQPGAWTGALREVLPASTEFVTTASGTTVEAYPPHVLLLLWPPQRPDAPHPSRWPQQVRLCALPLDEAAAALLAQAPADARLWLQPAAPDIDWALAAELVLHHDAALRPFLAEGLRSFIAAEREATFLRLNSAYLPTPQGAALKG